MWPQRSEIKAVVYDYFTLSNNTQALQATYRSLTSLHLLRFSVTIYTMKFNLPFQLWCQHTSILYGYSCKERDTMWLQSKSWGISKRFKRTKCLTEDMIPCRWESDRRGSTDSWKVMGIWGFLLRNKNNSVCMTIKVRGPVLSPKF